MKNLFQMKKLLYSLSMLVCLLGVTTNAWAGSDMYARLTVKTSNTAYGLVYAHATKTDGTPDESGTMTVDNKKYDSSGSKADVTFKVHAYPKEGYEFVKWIVEEGTIKSIGSSTAASTTVTITSTSTNENSPTAATIKASFKKEGSIDLSVDYLVPTGGTYTVTGDEFSAQAGDMAKTTPSRVPMIVTATPNPGYIFYKFYTLDENNNKSYIGTPFVTSQEVLFENDVRKVQAEFTNDAFRVGESFFSTFSDALQFARTSSVKTIFALRNYTIPSGYYTIPSDVSLVIPKNVEQATASSGNGWLVDRVFDKVVPSSAFVTLTLDPGVTMEVHGSIEVGGTQNVEGQGDTGIGRPGGSSYGHLVMKPGSKMTLNEGAKLYAWGFVTGDNTKDETGKYLSGEIDVRRGATVYEQFQMYDWKGGSASSDLLGNDEKIFIITQYFIQNVEVPAKYHPGAKLLTSTGTHMRTKQTVLFVDIVVDLVAAANDAGIIGVYYGENDPANDVAMFLMDDAADADNTWVLKWYDVQHDRQVYEVNNSARLGSIHISMTGDMSYDMNSAEYILPVSNNFKIHLLTGDMLITQSTELLPGSEIEINKEATVQIKAGETLYLYDDAEWGSYAFDSKVAHRIKYRPYAIPTNTQRNISSKEALGDAKLNVHGTFVIEHEYDEENEKDINGALYTTAGGANIFSNNADAGTIIYQGAPGESVKPIGQISGTKTKVSTNAIPAILRNTTGQTPAFADTKNTPAGQSYCFIRDKWTMMTVDPDDPNFVYDNYGVYYAKPGAYVAINATKTFDGDGDYTGFTGNDDMTYSDLDGLGRLYIFMLGDQQWWEVELDPVSGLYKGVTRDEEDNKIYNGKFYYFDDGQGWMEKKYIIKWNDYDGTLLKSYNLTYGVMPEYTSTTPSRTADADYIYNFTGWSPAIEAVTGDQTYTATYSAEVVKYEIIFKYKGGAEIDRQFLVRDANPTVPVVTQPGKYLKWSPSVGPVTGNQTYEAEWMDALPDNYTITWKNYDGKILKTTTPERNATAETVLAGAPTDMKKTSTAEYTYSFKEWKPAVVAATGDATYVAQYAANAITYTVNFYKENTTDENKEEGRLLASRTGLMLGEDPEVPAYSKENPVEGHTYTLQWKNMDTGAEGVGVPSVTGNANYVATFRDIKNRYTVTASCAIPSACSFTGTGAYEHGTSVTLSVTPNPGYEFIQWSDENTSLSRTFELTSNQEFVAVLQPATLTIEKGDPLVGITRATTVSNLILCADDDESGQLTGVENVTIMDGGNAYFDLTLNTWSRHWNAFAVPFEVDLKNSSIVEVKTKGGVATNRTLRYGRDYDIVYYKESVRATSGPSYNCWDYVDSKNKVLTPGEAYLIAFTSHVGTIRFTGEQDGEHHIKLGTSVEVSYTTPADPKDGGWNGIGNPRTYHALLNAGVTECQIHNGDTIGSDSYLPYEMTNKKFVVGKAAFVKVGAAQSVVVERATTQSAITPKAAPRRTQTIATGGDRYTVEIMPENGKLADRLFLLIDEDKADEYLDGKDLPKAGIGSTRAQMWVNRYGTKLCKNTIAPTASQADYPLGIYAPKAGEYTIYIAAQPEGEQALYLTLDGTAIWNLCDGACTLNLERGTANQYGLRVSAKAPQVATGIDEAIVDAHGNTQKVLINDQVYIIRGDKVYSLDGQLVK